MQEFKPLSENNVHFVAEIEDKCFVSEKWSENLLRGEIGDKDKYYIVFYDNEIPVGFGGFIKIFNEGHITEIAVLPEFRNQGIGTKILHNLIDYGKNNGISAFTLEVRESNTTARMLYEKHSFEFVGKRPKYYPDKEDACIYWLYIER